MTFSKIIDEVGLNYRHDGDCLVVVLPDDHRIRVHFPIGGHFAHLWLPPDVAKLVRRSFDIVPTLDGDYLADAEAFRKIMRMLAERLESEAFKMAHKSVSDLALDMKKMSETEQKSEAVRRIGQDKLRACLLLKFGACQISRIRQEELLVASHIKTWSMCANGPDERLDLENVLLLAANWDALFDKFYISFDPETGRMLKAWRIDEMTLAKFGVPADWRETVRVDVAGERRREYLRWHNAKMEEKDLQAKNGCGAA